MSTAAAAARRLEGKKAVITGGAAGIGEDTARLFVAHGAAVCIVDIDDDLGRRLCAALGGEPSAYYCHCDVRVEADVIAAVDFAVARLGGIDIFVNNAGVSGERVTDIRKVEFNEFKRTVEINLNGAFLGMKHAAGAMIPRLSGAIVSIGSVASAIGGLGPHAYTASKHALVGLTKSVAGELGKHGIRVNCVSPYAVPTRLSMPHLPPGESQEDMVKAFYDFVGGHATLKGVNCDVRDVANAVLFLASDDAKYISGVNLLVDGGFTSVNLNLKPFED